METSIDGSGGRVACVFIRDFAALVRDSMAAIAASVSVSASNTASNADFQSAGLKWLIFFFFFFFQPAPPPYPI